MNAPGFRTYLVAVLAAGWAILSIASARGGKWPIMLVCLVMLAANLVSLYRLTRRQDRERGGGGGH